MASTGRVLTLEPFPDQNLIYAEIYCGGGGAAGWSDNRFVTIDAVPRFTEDSIRQDAVRYCNGTGPLPAVLLAKSRRPCAEMTQTAPDHFTLKVCSESQKDRTVDFAGETFTVRNICTEDMYNALTNYIDYQPDICQSYFDAEE